MGHELDAEQPDGEWDRSVVVGEASGRWLWLVIRPASAILLLREEWQLRDVSGLGMALVEVPFGGPHTRWWSGVTHLTMPARRPHHTVFDSPSAPLV